jgi:prevent-host-death family protein
MHDYARPTLIGLQDFRGKVGDWCRRVANTETVVLITDRGAPLAYLSSAAYAPKDNLGKAIGAHKGHRQTRFQCLACGTVLTDTGDVAELAAELAEHAGDHTDPSHITPAGDSESPPILEDRPA